MKKWIYYDLTKEKEKVKKQLADYDSSKFPVFCKGFLLDEDECGAKFLSFYKDKSQINGEGAMYFMDTGIALLADDTEFKF